MVEKVELTREATKITLDKVDSWEDLNAATLAEADQKFASKTRELWNEFAVSGVLQFDKKENKQVLKPFTDLDGNSALGILKLAGINTENLTFVRPGESLKGAINLDTGDKFGVVYDPESYTTWVDHHEKGHSEVTSTAEIMYETMVGLGMLERTVALDRAVDFVTKIDNRKYPAEEFLRSGKTILGLQRGLKFEQLVAYFEDHESPQEELTPEQFEKYGLRQAAEQQQKTVEEAMETLEKMEKEGKVVETDYGSVVINVNGELKVGSSAAYIRHEGILNITPGKSFALTLKEGKFDEETLRKRLGHDFQGKVIREQMWIYNDENGQLELSQADILKAVTYEMRFGEFNKLLSQHDVKTDLWNGEKGTKTVNDLFDELEAGETEIEVTPSGEVIRVVHVVAGDITYIDEKTKTTYRLREDRQVSKADGNVKRRPELQGAVAEKMKVGEDTVEATLRGIKEELGIAGDFEVGQEELVEEMRVTATYPGLNSKYKIHKVPVRIDETNYRPEGYIEDQPKKTNYFVWEVVNS